MWGFLCGGFGDKGREKLLKAKELQGAIVNLIIMVG